MTIIDRLKSIERALTVSELAALLSMSQRTIYQHAAAGRIPALRIGGAVRFDPSEVAKWLQREQ